MYKVILDSCGELTEEMKQSGHFVNVPLTLYVDDEEIIDDETLDQAELLQKIANASKCPTSACPSPDAFLKEMDCDADRIYVVTLSSNISGTYNSACLARNLLLEKKPDAKVYVVDSKSASVAETMIALKIQELEEEGLAFDKICEGAEEFVKKEHTLFVLEDLSTFAKTGRLGAVAAKVVNTMKIKPILKATDEGTVGFCGQARGMNKAIDRMADIMVGVTTKCEDRIVAITHCNCIEKARQLREALEARATFKDVIILDTSGLSTLYANDGGLILVI